MTRNYQATRQQVANRGVPPASFLDELVEWARVAPDVVFAVNDKFDIYSAVVGELGPWTGPLHRKAAMLESLRVLAGFESSWEWNAGVDTTNPTSNTPCTEEAGIFQCSGNSMNFSADLKQMLVDATGSGTCETFIVHTKADHRFAVDYCARLIRLTVNHHGPILHRHINPWLRRDAVAEFEGFL